MKKIILFLGILSMASFVCDAQKELEKVNTQLVISGRVVDAVTQKGIPDAKVQIKSGDSFKNATTKTDDTKTAFNEAGYFDVTDVVARGENILLIVTPPATDAAGTAKSYSLYIRQFDTYISPTEELAERQLNVGELGIVESTGTVTGTVFGIDGPLAGVTVVLENDYQTTGSSAAGDFYAEATSDANGVYTFSNVPKTNGYSIYNLPFDINSDGELDYGVATDSVNINHLAEAGAKNGDLALPTWGATFDLIFSNIVRFENSGTAVTGVKVLGSTTALVFNFNKTVKDDTTLEVTCYDITDGAVPVIPGDTTVSTSKVTFTAKNNWVLGHTYLCDITARSVVGELYQLSADTSFTNSTVLTATGATFIALDDTSPATISDFAFDLTQARADFCASNTSAVYTNIEKAGTSGETLCTTSTQTTFNAKFSFKIPANTDFVAFYFRHNDVSDQGSEWTPLTINEIVLPASLAATSLAQTSIDLKTATQSQVTEGSSVAFKANLRTQTSGGATTAIPTFSATRTTYLIVAACNQEQDGFGTLAVAADLNAAEISDGCTFSNVVELTSTR